MRFERVIFTGHPPTPNRALDWATRLAAVHAAKLETLPSEALPSAGRDLVVVERQHRLTAILPGSLQHKMLARGSGAVLLVPIGAPPLPERGPDLVVLERQHRIAAGLPGSLQHKLLARAAGAVLLVPQGAARLPEAPPLFRRVLCAVEFSDSLTADVAFVASLGGGPERITVLSVVSDVFPGEYAHGRYHFAPDQLEPHLEAQARETLERLVGTRDARFDLVVASGKPPKEIQHKAEQLAPDLLVLTGPFDAATLHYAASHATCPFLFVPPSPSP